MSCNPLHKPILILARFSYHAFDHTMKTLLSASYLILLFSAVVTLASEPLDLSPVVGIWEGDSKCTVPNSPCRDEHIIYHIAADKSGSDKLRLDAYKVVEGKQELMGTLDCLYRAGEILTCTSNSAKKDYWEFRIMRDRLIGSLVIGEPRTLYRRIAARKK
jgi:hypothetical protein